MKKAITALLLFLSFGAYAQEKITLSGQVIDSGSMDPVCGIDVYLDGSTLHTTTDHLGCFTLRATNTIPGRLVLSHELYTSVMLSKPFDSIPEKLYITKKTGSYKEASFIPDLFSRSEKIRAFREAFLGDTKSGYECTILNEDDLVLYFNSTTRELSVYCDKPVEIVNAYLGYRIYYYLDFFKASFATMTLDERFLTGCRYNGSLYFTDLFPGQYGKLDRRRKNVYRATPSYFFRWLIGNNSLKGSGYRIYMYGRMDTEVDPAENFIITETPPYRTLSIKQGSYVQKLAPEIDGLQTAGSAFVSFNKNFNSRIYFIANDIKFNMYGFPLHPADLTYSGYMGIQGVGDMLPLDFIINTDIRSNR